jgi:putative FmdB family regulatory protein
MPLYEYRCEACEHRFELIQKYSDQPVAVCPSCGGGPVEKLLSSPAIQFKGTGWYITDYARKGQSGTAAATNTNAAKSEGGGEPAAATPAADSTSKVETKTETKTESKPAAASAKKE